MHLCISLCLLYVCCLVSLSFLQRLCCIIGNRSLFLTCILHCTAFLGFSCHHPIFSCYGNYIFNLMISFICCAYYYVCYASISLFHLGYSNSFLGVFFLAYSPYFHQRLLPIIKHSMKNI